MQKLLFLLVLMSGTQQLFSQNYLFVKVSDEETNAAVSYALIQNRSHPQKIVSNEWGESRIPITDSTLLKISAISYEDYYYFIPNAEDVDSLKVLLKHKTYELSEFVVNPYPTVTLFKKAIADLDLPDTNMVSANLFMVPNLKGYAEQAKDYQEGAVFTIGFTSPISGIYNLVSKRAKSERKLKQLLATDRKHEVIHKRYNEDYVRQLTGIQELKKIAAFMEYCRPSMQLITSATDYELACFVLNCYQSFLLNNDP